jgi:hypothetical protein
MIMFGSFLPSRLVGFGTTKVYSGLGADIVMESISLIDMSNRDILIIGGLAEVVAFIAVENEADDMTRVLNAHSRNGREKVSVFSGV